MLWRIISARWVGTLWSIGALAAPLAFSVLPNRELAGKLARDLFAGADYLGVLCALFLLGLTAGLVGPRVRGTRALLVLMLALALVGRTVFDPWLESLRTGGGIHGAVFAGAHAAAATVYGVNALLGLWLIGRQPWTGQEAGSG